VVSATDPHGRNLGFLDPVLPLTLDNILQPHLSVTKIFIIMKVYLLQNTESPPPKLTGLYA
jgi:hypothetical protein